MKAQALLTALLALAVSTVRAERVPDTRGEAAAANADASGEPPSEPASQEDADLAPDANAGAGGEAVPQMPRRIVYPHFSDGPRAVPRIRGASLARAQALGIGGHETTRKLLWTRPSPELLAAVPGKAPKTLLWPVVAGTFGRGFGFTRKLRPELRHNGVDISAKEGAPVRAVADGLVLYSDNTLKGLGNAVIILHPGGFTTLYAHTQRTTVQPGYYVKRGERIAIVGHTGMAWGPHLHFELRDNGRWRDPEPLFVGRKDEQLQGPIIDLERVPPAKDAAPHKPERLRESAHGEPSRAHVASAGKPERSVHKALD